MNIEINRKGYRLVVTLSVTKDNLARKLLMFFWDELLAGLMLGFAFLVHFYFITGFFLGILIKLREIKTEVAPQIKPVETAKIGETKA